jgi:hypothetical protein
MTATQLVLSAVLATLVFSVALEPRLDDFQRVAQARQAGVAAQAVQRAGEVTLARPGRLVRLGRAAEGALTHE